MTIKSACVYAILVCTISFTWEFAVAGTPTDAKSAEITADTFCEVDAKTHIRDIPRTLYCTNIAWFNNSNGIIDDKGVFRSVLGEAWPDESNSLLLLPPC